MKKIFFLLSLLYCFGALAQDEVFQKANQAYQQGNPTEAISLYKSLQQSGVEDPALYFNMGNAYAAQGALGETILSYVRALRLSPADESIRANLWIARRHAAETSEPARTGPLFPLQEEQWVGSQSPASLAWRAFLLYSSGILILGASIFIQRRGKKELSRLGFFLSGALLLASAVFGFFSWQKTSAFHHETRAVILTSNTPVRRGPIESAESIYMLPIGEIVTLKEKRDSWGLIEVSEKPEGWVNLSQVESVLP